MGARVTIEAILQAERYVDTRVLDLGVTACVLRTNVAGFSGFRYFARVCEPASFSGSVPYELSCIDLDYPHAIDERVAFEWADRTFRGRRFRAGFYLTGHFGAPAALITRGCHHYVVGRGLDRVVWGWYVKYLLTRHSLRTGTLHVKAACVDVDGHGTLLIGRGSGGKTVFLTEMCRHGHAFVSNTHAVVESDGTVHGVPTTLRVRDDACFGGLIRSGGLRPHLAGDQDEFIADPTTLFASSAASMNVRNICVVDYQAGRRARVERLACEDAYNIFEQFGFPISTYGMKDDVLEMCGHDIGRFARVYADMKQKLGALVDATSSFYVSCDLTDAGSRTAVTEALRSSARGTIGSGVRS
jgi:hypothetical protein